MAFDINDRTTWAWKPFDLTALQRRGMQVGDYLLNPTDRNSYYQLVNVGDGSVRLALHQCAMEDDTTRLVFDPILNVCGWSGNDDGDARSYEYCIQQGWLERDER
ncbi:MAG: hypothetical protein M3319_11910 [Actinomycetota bacterium]|nr:hypothetical protein [Actinomycetota bacterium]MDQ3901097.1 hypothetical protein [Actinomycetota bacterium]